MSSSTNEDILYTDDVIDLNHDYYSSHDLHSIEDDELKLFHRNLVTPAPSVYNGEDDIIHRHMFRQRYNTLQRPISRGESVMLFKKINNGDEDVSVDLVSSELRDFIDTDSMSDDTFIFPVKETKKKIVPVILNYQQKKSLVAKKEIQVQDAARSRQVPGSPKIHRPIDPNARMSTTRKSMDHKNIPTTPRLSRSLFLPRQEVPKIDASRQYENTQKHDVKSSFKQHDIRGNSSKYKPSRQYNAALYHTMDPKQYDSAESSHRLSWQHNSKQHDTKSFDSKSSRQYNLTEKLLTQHDSKKYDIPSRNSYIPYETIHQKPLRPSDSSEKPSKQYMENDYKPLRRYETLETKPLKQYDAVNKPSRPYDEFDNRYKSLSSPRLRTMSRTVPNHESTTDEVRDSAKQVLATIRERRKSTIEKRSQYDSLAYDFRSKLNVREGFHVRGSSVGNTNRRTLASTTRLPQRSLYH